MIKQEYLTIKDIEKQPVTSSFLLPKHNTALQVAPVMLTALHTNQTVILLMGNVNHV